jgi:hypothetical protein
MCRASSGRLKSFDVFVSDNWTVRPGNSSYDAWYFSVGRSLGSRFYLTLDYSTSLSVLQLTDSGGLTVVNRPRRGVSASPESSTSPVRSPSW